MLYKIRKKSPMDVVVFFRKLATLLTAGIPILQSCDILYRSLDCAELRAIVMTIKTDLEAGKPFAHSLKKYPHTFDAFSCHLIQIGIQTGTFAVMLSRLAFHKEKMLQARNKIKQALFYPCIISIISLVISGIMLTVIVPRFADLFQNMHGTLPAFTQNVIGLSQWIRTYCILILIPIIGWILFRQNIKNSTSIKQFYHQCLLKLPILGVGFQKMALQNFASSLETTLCAGIPMDEALKLIANTTGNSLYTNAILKVQTDIAEGRPLHDALQKSALFSNILIQMVKIGEESGMLEPMLKKIVELYEADVDYLISSLTQLLEPLIMIVLGVLIGGLVIAMYLPIFKLGTIL